MNNYGFAYTLLWHWLQLLENLWKFCRPGVVINLKNPYVRALKPGRRIWQAELKGKNVSHLGKEKYGTLTLLPTPLNLRNQCDRKQAMIDSWRNSSLATTKTLIGKSDKCICLQPSFTLYFFDNPHITSSTANCLETLISGCSVQFLSRSQIKTRRSKLYSHLRFITS